MRRTLRLALSAALLGGALTAGAQTAAIKTNLLGWATTTPNIGVEFGVGRQSTLQLSGSLNPWKFGETNFKFWNVMPEYRYWFCEKFAGHFIGVHLLGGEYNFRNFNMPLTFGSPLPDIKGENKGRHLEGWYVGAGITYGYQWILNKHWNFELEIGVGYAYSPYDYYGRCNRLFDKNGDPVPADAAKYYNHTNYVGPTKLGASIMYVF